MALTGLVAANNLGDVVDIERTWDNIGSNISATVFVPAATLDLNFAGNKSLVDNISGSGLVTFTRASSGTFVGGNGLIQYVASGVPRFDYDPVTGESLGLLVEEARTNLCTYSEQFDDATWTKQNVTITSNTITAPDGTLFADLIVESTAVGVERNARKDINAGSTGQATRTIYVKAAGRYKISAIANGGYPYACYNLNTLTTFDVNGGTATISDVGNGWRRLSLTANASTTFRFDIGLLPDSATGIADRFYTGNGTSGIYIWGAQLEAGTFPTSYIPTTSSAVTRAADVASITGANFSSWYNNGQGTFYGEWTHLSALKSFATVIIGIDGNGNNKMLSSDYGTVASPSPRKRKAAIGLTDLKYGNTSNYSQYVNGSPGGSEPGINALVGDGYPYAITIGYQAGQTVSYLNSPIARLTYYPVRLSNITLQALTTYGPVSSFPYSFSIKGRDILALKEVNKTSTRDFVFIKGLLSKVQPRINTASQYTTSGVVFQQNALLKASPSSVGNYSIRSILAANLLKINGNNVASLSSSPFSATIAIAPISIASLGLGSTLQWTPAMPSGAITSPTIAIPIDFASFVLYAKAGQS